MKKNLLITAALFCLSHWSYGQYYQFSQYNFADQRVNPAVVASTDEASIKFLFRNQRTGGDFGINTTFVSAAYPFLTSRGKRWSGVGLSLSDDRSGGVFSTQEATVSYAANVFLSRYQTLSLGVKGLYRQRRLDFSGLYTGMQYITDRGFDEGTNNGENSGDMNNRMFTISLGGLWQQVDRTQSQVAYLGFSFFDFNKPVDSFVDDNSTLRGTFVGTAGIRVAHRGPLSVMAEALITNGYSNTVTNAGIITQYALQRVRQRVVSRVDVITRYVFGRSGIIGLQLHKENISFGVSYDFPVVVVNSGNIGAIEFGLSLHRFVDPKARQQAKRRKKAEPSNSVSTKPKQEVAKQKVQPDGTKTVVQTKPEPSPSPSVSESIKQKRDSVAASGTAGVIHHDPVVLEKAQLHFNFEFNSSDLDGESLEYLQQVAEVLKEDELLNVVLIGHTDNIGSASYNQKLSVRRADAVRKFLETKGVDGDRIQVDGKGMSEPLNENLTDEDRAANRRVEIQIIYSP